MHGTWKVDGSKGSSITVTNGIKVFLAVLLLFVSLVGIVVGLWSPGWQCSIVFQSDLCGYSKAAVASDAKHCAGIATKILEDGGTAADAGIAAMFCSGVVNPHSSGMGGGFLLTFYSKTEGKAYSLNAREVAPLAATVDMFRGNSSLSLTGGLSIAVPGEVKGYKALYDRFGGGVPWSDLIQPAIDLAEGGVAVNWHLASALKKKKQDILQQKVIRSILEKPEDTGNLIAEGDVLRLPRLAETLRALQKDPEALYRGKLAEDLVGDIERAGGIITIEDLEGYQVQWSDSVTVNLNTSSTTLHSVPPPGSGIVLANILTTLDNFGFNGTSLDAEKKKETYRRIVESFKYAYGYRTLLGDAQFEDMEELMSKMSSANESKILSDKILSMKGTSLDPAHYGAHSGVREDHGTSHLSIISEAGDALSATSTINTRFGSLVVSESTGIFLNNEMDDFSSAEFSNVFGAPPSPANYIKPGKRPLSSMSPSIFVNTDGDVSLVTGAAGGTKITTAIANTAIGSLWFGKGIKSSISAPRLHHQLVPMVLQAEQAFDEDVVEFLSSIGHNVTLGGLGGVVTALVKEEDGRIYSYADPRKSGNIQGY